jgi:hypothetical protein
MPNDDSPLRGAAPVNDDLEVGYDEAFETRWRHTQFVSHGCMVILVVAAAAGVFGRGPLSHRTLLSTDARLMVDFEPLARYGTSTQITLYLSSDVWGEGQSGTAHVVLNSALIEPMGLQQVIPEPASSAAVAGGTALVFNVPEEKSPVAVRFVVKPNNVGPIRLEARQGGTRLGWTQFVLP